MCDNLLAEDERPRMPVETDTANRDRLMRSLYTTPGSVRGQQ
jgi:hypothetical protein